MRFAGFASLHVPVGRVIRLDRHLSQRPLSNTRIISGRPAGVALNQRQQRIVGQIKSGVRLFQKEVLAHFRTKWNASTAKRDLKGLRARKIIRTNPAGNYVLIQGEAQAA